jgi:hypothetical protein
MANGMQALALRVELPEDVKHMPLIFPINPTFQYSNIPVFL